MKQEEVRSVYGKTSQLKVWKISLRKVYDLYLQGFSSQCDRPWSICDGLGIQWLQATGWTRSLTSFIPFSLCKFLTLWDYIKNKPLYMSFLTPAVVSLEVKPGKFNFKATALSRRMNEGAVHMLAHLHSCKLHSWQENWHIVKAPC